MKDKIKLNEHIRVFFKDENGSHSLVPLKINDEFMLCAVDDVFMFDGYTVVRLEDIEEIHIRPKYREMLKGEKVFDNIEVPNITIDSWKDVFNSLYELNENIILESDDLIQNNFLVGRIEKVMEYGVTFRAFDTNGDWDKDASVISYSHITSVTFKSRYINVFSKYLNN